MSNYTKATNFAVKDGLVTTDPAKIIKGLDIDNEFNAISNAIASKTDVTSPSLLGTPTAPTATTGTNTTQIATTAFVTAATVTERTATATLTNKTLTSPAINTPTIVGGSITGITDLTVADGGTGVSTLTANAVLIGNGTSGITSVSPSTSGNVLTSNGTAWTSANPVGAGSLSANGYQTLAGGLILAWTSSSEISSETSSFTINFPVTFTTVFKVIVSTRNTSGGADRIFQVNSFTTSSVNVFGNQFTANGGSQICDILVIGV